jgi:hypothetical protein
MINKSQHIVPRFYLEQFTDSATPPGQEPYVWVYEHGGSSPYAKAPKKLSVQSYYYSYIGPDGERDDTVDDLLQAVENVAAPILRELVAGREPADLNEQERGAFAYFLGTLSVRVPRFRNAVQNFAAELARKVSVMGAQHPEYFERTMREAYAAKGEAPPKDIESVRQFVLSGEYTVEASPLVSLQSMIALAPVEACYAYSYEWRLLHATGEDRFVSSDCPMVKVSTERLPFPWGLGTGWETPWMEATVPLSPVTCLLISAHHPTGTEHVPSRVVRDINLRTAASATDAVYSSRVIEPASLNRPSGWTWWCAATDVITKRDGPAKARGEV